jgi:outer membrane protein assembly factor BamB
VVQHVVVVQQGPGFAARIGRVRRPSPVTALAVMTGAQAWNQGRFFWLGPATVAAPDLLLTVTVAVDDTVFPCRHCGVD